MSRKARQLTTLQKQAEVLAQLEDFLNSTIRVHEGFLSSELFANSKFFISVKLYAFTEIKEKLESIKRCNFLED